MTDQSQLEQKLMAYVKKNTPVDTSKLTETTLLFRDGVFDSMAFVLLIDYLEETYNIKASDSDLIEENFESVSAIAGYIIKKSHNNAAVTS